jgi:hypothetical protein
MEVAVDGSGSNGVFAAAINVNDWMLAAASTTAAQLMTTTAIAAATISQRRHCRRCNYIIIPPSHLCLHQGQPLSTKTTIAAAAIGHHCSRPVGSLQAVKVD